MAVCSQFLLMPYVIRCCFTCYVLYKLFGQLKITFKSISPKYVMQIEMNEAIKLFIRVRALVARLKMLDNKIHST